MRLSVSPYGRLLAALGLATSLSLTALSAVSATHGHTHTAPAQAVDAAQARQQATDLTQALVALQKQWANAKGAEKSRALENLIHAAQERRAALVDLAMTHPEEVLRAAIPDKRQLGMPQEVVSLLEQQVEITGESDVFYEDYADGSHKLRRFVKTPFGERFELSSSLSEGSLQSGESLSVDGVLLPTEDATDSDGVMVAKAESIVTAECCTQESTTTSPPPAGRYTFGEQKVLVMLVNFEDNTTQPWTTEQVRDVVFGTVNDFYLENSSNRTWLTGDVTGWLTLPISSTVCDYYGLDSAAASAASAAGIDTSAYQRIVYAFPKNACGWAGLGTIGSGTYSRAWLNGYVTPYVAGHELGHNLGLGHSGGLECGSDVIEGAGSCTGVAYGNRLDIMGSPNTGHFNAFQKERLGWLDQGLTTVSSGGTYTLEPYSLDSSTTKALKVLQGTDASTGEQTWYYIEFRQPIGFDSFITTSTSRYPVDAANVMNGVVINRGNLSDYNSSRLLDMTPGSDANINFDFNDSALEVGERFYDANSGVEIATNWVNGDQINVSITTAPMECVPAAPTLSLTPKTSEWVPAGTQVEFVVNIVNNDSQACPATTYQLSSTVPSGWTQSYGSQTASLAPGETASSSLYVTSSATAADGFYDIPVTVSGGSNQVTDSMTYVVDTPVVNSAPVAQNDSASTDYEKAVIIDVLNNDSDPDGDALAVTLVSNLNGSALINSDGTISFTPAKGFSGTETFNYSISDGQGGSASATVSVDVAAAPVTNSAPVAQNDTASTDYEQAVIINVLGNDSDPDGDALTVTQVNNLNGSALINANGTITYTPAKGFSGTVTFSYSISDGQGGSASATVNVDVAAAPVTNSAPVAQPDSAATDKQSPVTIAVLANDSDADGDTLQLISATQGSKGSVALNDDGTLTYYPAKNFRDGDSFTYAISDGSLISSTTVTILVSSGATDTTGGGGKGGGNGKGPSK
ncbi:peptidase M11 [Marinobacterium zhoushanense]|uniref:Peptidase M11 n=1 Tax=Marinobacterium zhoushanense TaxID=1679163 RepID=A0ABQ1KJA2_9GAMM|nr:cadherin-like domain-containing protein [Marinobacterium zhoushanense]GGC02122.1 peptidase M11 [Marinobacterium zhoushanense]